MKKKITIPYIIIIILSIVSIILLITTISLWKKLDKKECKIEEDKTEEKVDEQYIAYFEGGNDKITYRTYIYKINNNQDNYGFRYTNTIIKTIDGKEQEEIVGEGEVSWTDDVFVVAKKHGAYSYVKYNGKDKKYTIDEFASMFLMN